MSMHALLLAVRNAIRTGTANSIQYADKDCDIAPPNGQPPPSCGPVYVAVHEGRVDADNSYSTFEDIYTVHVTVTVRLRGVPWDRMVQQELYGKGDGYNSLDTRCRQIAALIHWDTYNHVIINAANALAQVEVPAVGYAKQGFVEPLRFAGIDVAKEVGPGWFHATPAQMESADPPCGWAKTVRFTGARRVQETLFAEAIGVVS